MLRRVRLLVAVLALASGCNRSAAPTFHFAPPAEQNIALALVAPAPAIREIEAWIPARTTLSEALGGHGLAAPVVHEVVTALASVLDFRKIRPGARYTMRVVGDHEERLDYFRLEGGTLDVVEANRAATGELVGRRIDVPVETREAVVGVAIAGSLYESLDVAGESPELATLLAEVFAWDLDFQRDQQAGDRFRMVVEKIYSGDTLVGYGRVLAAEYDGEVGTFRTFWFEPAGAPREADYFLEDGRSARKMFLATPLKLTRVTSSFSTRRRHPILGYDRAHLGVDYAAPTGTPIRAMANGVVTFAGWSGGSGNLVRIRHSTGLESSYAHLRGVARGVRPGIRVSQKQTIGYVGSTGLATGPHLHFAVKKDGRYVNPQKLDFARLESVPPARRAEFLNVVAERSARLAGIVIAPRAPLAVATAHAFDTTRELYE